MDNRYINQIEVLVNLFTISKGKLNVLLFRKEEEPFKGYWMLPSNLLMTTETIEECAKYTINEMAGIENIYLKQCNVFSKIDRLPNDRILGNSLIGLVDNQTLFLKRHKRNFESAWFPINELPKMVYDHGDILKDTINYLRKELTNAELLKKLFPSDFTMPELQVVFEEILDKKLDRRNFRKKLINLNILEDTGDKNNTKNGRPAKLYRFKELESNIDIF
jgi:8-oxo-dGTP diphosphatase